MKWESIDTAPRDGTILLFYLGEEIDRYYVSPKEAAKYTIGFFGDGGHQSALHDGWYSVESKEEIWGYGSEYTGPMYDIECIPIKPTHWIMLSKPNENT